MFPKLQPPGPAYTPVGVQLPKPVGFGPEAQVGEITLGPFMQNALGETCPSAKNPDKSLAMGIS
jgi:hypothetical protein